MKTTDCDGATLRSLVAKEHNRLKNEYDTSREAYWAACKNVGEACAPPMTAKEVSRISMRYIQAGKGKAKRPAARPKSLGSAVFGNWAKVNWAHIGPLTLADEFSIHLRDMKVGLNEAITRTDLTREEAKRYQAAFGSWVRNRYNKKQWYDSDGNPRYRTAVTEYERGKWQFTVVKIK